MQRNYSENLVKRRNELKLPGGGEVSETGGGSGGSGEGDEQD